MLLTVYGIKNCNTVKTALAWLDGKGIDYQFNDYKTSGVADAKLRAWCKQVGWESLVNKRGMTWRQLPAEIQESVKNLSSAIALMKTKTSVIKRPLIESGSKIIALGFDEDSYQQAFK